MNYQDAKAKLGNRESRKLANNTYLKLRDGNRIAVLYHATDVVTFDPDGSITLDSGGWHTYSTKDRIRNYSPLYISQQNGVWYVSNGDGNEVTFADGMTYRDGRFSGAGPDASVTEKQRKRVRQFAQQFIAKLRQFKIPSPNAGDCFYCHMREVESLKPLGEITHDKSHIDSHLQEKYFVPSLLWNALEWRSSQVNKWLVSACWRLNADANDAEAKQALTLQSDHQWKEITRNLTRYIYLQMGL